MNIQASQESVMSKHLKMQRDIAFTAEFLESFGGSDMRFNRFSETITFLRGIQNGISISDNASELADTERERAATIGSR